MAYVNFFFIFKSSASFYDTIAFLTRNHGGKTTVGHVVFLKIENLYFWFYNSRREGLG